MAQPGIGVGQDVSRHDAVEWLARAGILARGFVYGVIAVLAIKLAVGDGGKATDQQGAMKTLAQSGFGKLLLVLLAIGLFGYAAWRLIRAAVGHGVETGDDDAKDRVSGLFSGITYFALFASAVKILGGSGSGGGGSSPDKATGGVLDWPAGTVLVGGAGLVLIGIGLYQAYTGVKQDFCKESKTVEMHRHMRRTFKVVGTAGHLARGVVFVLMGAFVLKAAIEFDPKDAVGLDGALAKLAHASYGPVLLGIVALGLLGFAIYSVLDSRYARV